MDNKWNTLLRALDLAYGTSDRASSRFKTVKQSFDNARQEYTVLLEYRWRRNHAINTEVKNDKKKQDLNKAELLRKKQAYELLQQINKVA